MRLLLASSLSLALTLAATTALAVPPSKATPGQKEEAQTHFSLGKDLLAQKRLDAALVELRASLEIVQSPNARLALARTLRELGRLPQAWIELRKVDAESKDDAKYEKAAEAAAAERAEIEPKIGFVDVRGGTNVKIAGEDRGADPMPVMPGVIEVSALRGSRSITIAPGEHAVVALDDAPSPAAPIIKREIVVLEAPGPSPLRTISYVAGGVALAGLTTFVVSGLMARSTHADLEEACHSGPCSPGHENEIERGKSQQTVANVGLVVFGASAAAAVTLFVLGSPSSEHAQVGAGLGRLEISGTF